MFSRQYVEWLVSQSKERRAASARHMRVCRLLGIARHRYPLSRRAAWLSGLVSQYYAEFPE